MNLFICLFGPSLLAIKLFVSLNKKISNRDMFIYYGIFVFLLNFIASFLTYLFWGFDGNINKEILNSNLFALKYTLLATIIILFVVPLFDIIIKNINISFEVVKNEKSK